MSLELVEQTLRSGKNVILSGLSAELSLKQTATKHGAVLEVARSETASRFKTTLGRCPELERYVVCHRYEAYWMKPQAGDDFSAIPTETQFLLAKVGGAGWLLLVPLIDDPLRFSLQGKPGGVLELLAETGDAKVSADAGCALYVACADDPFRMMADCAADVARHFSLNKLRRDKPLPRFVDQFGWCTWDAFYDAVSADKVKDGLARFKAGGVAPKMMILDDGWLSMRRMPAGEKRLTSFAANDKFPKGLGPLIQMAKAEFGIDTFLVWHTIVGYWGGVDKGLRKDVLDQVRHFGEGILAHVPAHNIDWWGELVGYVPADGIASFYDDFHRSLKAEGVDGVKVDSQALLEAVSQGQGGRVAVSRAYRKALEASVQRHFGGALINCMSNAQETYYLSPDSTLIRSSIDYFPKQPASHGLHLYTNAMVGLWFGQFMHPDWDMFQSGHQQGAFHAAGRAVSGGPVYVSDKPGEHDFELLNKLVCSDGTILRADQPGLPTEDCLLVDPTKERHLLKIWNRNKSAALIGAFNCFYAEGEEGKQPIEGRIAPGDVPGLTGDRFAVFAHQLQSVLVIERADSVSITLAPGKFELFSMVPIVDGFAPIGLADKFNSRGAVMSDAKSGQRREVELSDGGSFIAYSERQPASVSVNDQAVPFSYDEERKRLDVCIEGQGPQLISVQF